MLTREHDLPAAFGRIAFDSSPSILCAVSGGSDSIALLLHLRAHLANAHPAVRVHAATVDHGLRPESRREAEEVAALCESLSVPHRVLDWTGPRPVTGIQMAARHARYRLLAEAARACGATIVATGHTADDQAETAAMRAARGTGPGSAGIAPATLCQGEVWFVRPLLATRRPALRRFLASRGAKWTEDPSNTDPRFERSRVRAMLSEAEIDRLCADAALAAQSREAMSEKIAAMLRDHASQPGLGLFRLDRRGLLGEESAVETLRLLVAVVGGRDALPSHGKLARLIDQVRSKNGRVAVGGCVVEARHDAVFLHREWRGEGPATQWLQRGDFWDGRFRLAKGETMSVGCLPAHQPHAEGTGRDWLVRLLAEAAKTEPFDPDRRLVRIAGPWRLLLPSFDLPAACEVSRLIESKVPRPAPWTPSAAFQPPCRN